MGSRPRLGRLQAAQHDGLHAVQEPLQAPPLLGRDKRTHRQERVQLLAFVQGKELVVEVLVAGAVDTLVVRVDLCPDAHGLRPRSLPFVEAIQPAGLVLAERADLLEVSPEVVERQILG